MSDVARNPRSPLLGLPGAVAGGLAPIDGGAVAGTAPTADHYGDPVAEQRMLAAGGAIVDLSDRGVITVTGPDRLTWLDSLTSQALTLLAPGDSAETLLLDPNGRVEHSIRIVDDGVAAWLLVEQSQTAALVAWLDRMRFTMRVEIADVSADWATLMQFTPQGDNAPGDPPDAALAPLLVTPATSHGVPLVWRDPWPTVQLGGWQYALDAPHPGSDYRAVELLIERARLGEVVEAVRTGTVKVAGNLAVEALRIAAWRPRLGAEVDDRTIPHELDWMRSAVHLAKGCYRGQETVAKVHNIGHPPRRLVMLHLDGSDALLPGAGAPVLHGDKVVGAVTSSARHHELGPIALAVVKRSLDPTATLVVALRDAAAVDSAQDRSVSVAIAAAQQMIVPPGAGATAGVPRLPRLGAVQRPV